jgi:hypothetical protein
MARAQHSRQTAGRAGRIKLCVQPQPIPIVLPEALAPDRARAIRSIKRTWVNGTLVQFHFLESDKWRWPKAQKDIVRWAFKTWKDVRIGLEFEETKDATEAEIRIGALQDDGSWSYVGTDCLEYKDLSPTMNFGWDLRTPWGRATALHEIGHALGMPHEHQNPNAGIVWNEALVYEVFAGEPNKWDRETIRHNIINKLSRRDTEGSQWDPASIMHYPFEPGLISAPRPYDARGIGENLKLSSKDKAWVRRFYPSGASAVPIGVMQLEQLDAAAGEQRDYEFVPPATRHYTIQTVGESDSKLIVFEERDGKPRYLAGKDDSGQEGNACLNIKLIQGRRYIIRVRVVYLAAADGVGLLVF